MPDSPIKDSWTSPDGAVRLLLGDCRGVSRGVTEAAGSVGVFLRTRYQCP